MEVTTEEEYCIGSMLARYEAAVVVAGILTDKINAEKKLNIFKRLVENANLDLQILMDKHSDSFKHKKQ